MISEIVEYIAIVDPGSANPDGTYPDGAPILLDAIPSTTIKRLLALGLEQSAPSLLEHMDYLLLQVDADIFPKGSDVGNGWFRILVSQDRFDAEGPLFETNSPVFGPSRDEREEQFYVTVLGQASPDHVKFLAGIASLSIYPDSSVDDIKRIVGNFIAHELAVGVYDIGQGNLNALTDCYEHPLIFFDLGWPLPFSKKSAPLTTAFDPLHSYHSENAPVILSHLDFDHWLYAVESGRASWHPTKKYWRSAPTYRKDALNRPWIVRRPDRIRHSLGMGHLHFLLTLATTALSQGEFALQLWPHAAREIKVDPVTIFTCVPHRGIQKAAYLRNNEGLAVLIRGDRARVLLCGDADYPSIPSAYKSCLTGLVAPHHGGAVTSDTTPASAGHGRMVVSTFETCYSNIPHPATLDEAWQAGWRVARTDDRTQCSRCGTEHGHRLIRLNMSPRCGCRQVDNSQMCISKP